MVNKAIFQSNLAMFGIMSDHLSILAIRIANPHVKCGLCILLICLNDVHLKTSLVPSPSPHVRERGSGALNDFSCHMGRGSSPI